MIFPEIQVVISELELFPHQLAELINDISIESLKNPMRDGGWTIAQNLNHLADSAIIIYTRIKLILTEEHPRLKSYNSENWANLDDAKDSDIRGTLNIITGLYYRLTKLLYSLQKEDYKRTGYLDNVGDITIADFLKIIYNHSLDHFKIINDYLTN